MGTRIASLGAGVPKVLLPIQGQPFLWFLLRALRQQGVIRVILSTGHLGSKVADYVQRNSWDALDVRCIQESEPLGTGGAIRLAVDTMQHNGPWLILNGDTFFSGAIHPLQVFHEARTGAQGSLALVEVPDAARYGRVEVDPVSGAVVRFAEKDQNGRRSAWINAGMYILGRELVDDISPGCMTSLEHEVFPRWVGRGLYGCKMGGARLLDIGTPEDYVRAQHAVGQFISDHGA